MRIWGAKNQFKRENHHKKKVITLIIMQLTWPAHAIDNHKLDESA